MHLQRPADGPEAGAPNDFHLAHYAARAAGGAGLVLVEATGVVPEGRISPFDLGLWSDAQVPAHRRLAGAIAAAGAVPGDPARPRRAQGLHGAALAGRGAGARRPTAAGQPSAPAPWPSRVTRRRAAMEARDIEEARARLGRRPPGARSRPGTRSWRSTPRTATCCTPSSPRSPTPAPTSTAEAWRTGPGSCLRSSTRCARCGRRTSRCSCGSPPPTGSARTPPTGAPRGAWRSRS